MINKEKKIILWISWWPDSMFLYNFIKEKFEKRKIIIAHFNHKFRKEADFEENFLKDFFGKEWIVFHSKSYDWTDFREWTLRKERYNFFKKLWWWKYYLVLWHNLTDRIETTFLNISRWTGLKGFLNMKEIDENLKIYRPLIEIEKSKIQKLCDENKIPYFLDASNLDSNISKRNMLRNEILPSFSKVWLDFYKNFNKIYKQIENILPNINIENHLETADNWIYKLLLPQENIDYFVRELLEYFQVYDFRSNVIPEIINYIKNAKWWGFKKYNNLIIFKKNNIIYVCDEIYYKNRKNIWQKNN